MENMDTDIEVKIVEQGPVVQRPISVNPGLKF